MKKIIPVILLSIWGLFCIIGILGNMDHYRVGDWIVIILIALLPYAIFLIVKLNSKKKKQKNSKSKQNTPTPAKDNYNSSKTVQSKTDIQPNNVALSNSDDILSLINTQNDIRVLKDCQNIMINSKNLDTFFRRYEMGLSIIQKTNDTECIKNYESFAVTQKINVLHKSFQNELKTMSSIKTFSVQKKHLEDYLELLKKYEGYYTTDYHAEYDNIVQTVQTKIMLASNDNDISKVATEALVSGIKVTVTSDTSDLEKYSREASEKGYAAHVDSYKNLDFKNISLKDGNPLQLDEIEKKFLKVLSNQQVDKLNFPVYWTYEYHVNYKEWITKLIENGYIRIAPSTEDLSFLTVEQLKSVLKILHLPTSGKKQELVVRISNQSGTENALRELGLYNERFILTEIGKEAIASIPPPQPIPKEDRLTRIMRAKSDFERIGTEAYEILAVLDQHTCDKCREMDKKHFLMSEFKVGETAPPFHDGCMCTIVPFTENWDEILIGKEAVNSIPKATKKVITPEDLYVTAENQGKQLDALGAEKYQILCTLDFQTCDKCGKMDGKVFDVKNYKPGVTAPPFHEGCRCATVPYLEDDIWGEGERIARDKNGKAYYVSGKMTYSKWKKTLQED